MTRKKFIKQAMSKGYSRNEATGLANKSVKLLGSYEKCHMHLNVAIWLTSDYRRR